MSRSERELVGLVGDVGGTNARFAIARVGPARARLVQAKVLRAADYATGGEAVAAYLAGLKPTLRPRWAVIAAAGPIQRGAVSFTNHRDWRFSESRLTEGTGLERVRLINDFTAQALALEHLPARALRLIGPRGASSTTGCAVIVGPGTGFGAAARAYDGEDRATVTGEGGHVAFAPTDAVEVEILRRLTARFGRVSIERVLSGPGLVNLYLALGEIGGEPAPLSDPVEITKAAEASDGLCRRAVDRFCAILGSVAGDFALAFGAKKGVYISGGIAPGLLDRLAAGAFRRRFEDKGRMSGYLRAIPTRVVLEPRAALIGAASLLETLPS